MVKVVQFGEGNFLRTFVDAYFNMLNEEGEKYKVNIIQPIPFGNLDAFKNQNNKYNIVLRGMEGGKEVEFVYKINVIDSVISPFDNKTAFYNLAEEKDLKIIVSNTTEAGICYNRGDMDLSFEKITYPAKLTQFLYRRFNAGLEGVYILPTELIDNNADELYKCVNKYITLFEFPEKFRKWNNECNYYCNTLVDRIVSGHPRGEGTLNRLYDLVGEKDDLLSVGEPFGLWVVEQKGDISKYIKEGIHNIEVVLTNNIEYYKKRKVRVLNGSHTNIVAVGLWHGAITVYDCMMNNKLSDFLKDTLDKEIIPFVSDDIVTTIKYADSVRDRFMNPFLNHQLTSIALNSISKWRARDLPSFKDYYDSNGKIAENLTIGFSYLMAMYCGVYYKEGKYYVDLPSRTIEIKDEVEYLDYFVNGGSIDDFMKKENVFGENLLNYKGFKEAVIKNVKDIKKGKNLL